MATRRAKSEVGSSGRAARSMDDRGRRWLRRSTGVAAFAVACWPGLGQARPTAPVIFCEAYAGSPECLGRVANCSECHVSTAPPVWNAYGQQLIASLPRDVSFEEALPTALMAVESGDADDDGDGNRDEIMAGTLPGDPFSFWLERTPSGGEHNPQFAVGDYDYRFALRRAMVSYCGRSPTYDELVAFDANLAGLSEAEEDERLHERLHVALDGCLRSEHFSQVLLPRLADKRIRPVFSTGPETTLRIGQARLVLGDYRYDYRLWRYLLTGDRDVRELLTAQYHVEEDAAGELVRVDGPIAKPDRTALAGGQPLAPERRAGLLTTQWFLSINTMFSGLPRTTAAQAYRSFLGADLANSDGIRPVSGEPVDIDDKGVDGAVCAQCHSTLDPLAYAFAKYAGIDDGYAGAFGAYDPTRVDRYLPGWSDTAQQAWLLGRPVSDLVEWASVAAASDEFKRNMADMFFQHALSRGPAPDEAAEFAALWQSLPADGHSAWRLIHRLVDTTAFGVP
jgi:hypothetical protein